MSEAATMYLGLMFFLSMVSISIGIARYARWKYGPKRFEHDLAFGAKLADSDNHEQK